MQFAKKSHPNWQNKNYFKFCFTDDFLELQLKEEQCYKGWDIWPSDYPCMVRDMPNNHAVYCILAILTLQISQNDVDIFWKDRELPCCQVKVIAQNTPETTQHLNYPVPIKNIDPEKTVFIQCSLTETNQSCELWEIFG